MSKKRKYPTLHAFTHPSTLISIGLIAGTQVYMVVLTILQKFYTNQIILTAITTPIIFALLYVAIAYYKKIHLNDFRYEKAKPTMYTKGMLGLVLMFALSIILPLLIGKTPQSNQEALNALFVNSYIPLTIYMVIGAPIIEELVFRDFLPNVFYYKKSAYIVTTILFAALHAPTGLTGIVMYGGLSCIFAYLRYAGGHIRYSIIMHIAWNSFSVIIMYVIAFS